MEKMLTADPTLTPVQALTWAQLASNTMDLVEGITPHTLVFGRDPTHPALASLNPGDHSELDISETLAAQLNAMVSARQFYAECQANKNLRQALKQRIYADVANIKKGDWIYYQTSVQRYWKGPVKISAIDGKRIYVIQGGRLLTINSDDVKLHKEEEDFKKIGEKYVSLPRPESFPQDDPPNDLSMLEEESGEESSHQEVNTRADVHQETTKISKNTSTAIDNTLFGFPVVCNVCDEEMTSLKIVKHAKTSHNKDGTVRSLARAIPPTSDSIYNNLNHIMRGLVLVNKNGEYYLLEEKRDSGWNAKNIFQNIS